MKVLKDPGRVLRVMDEKLDELRKSRKRFPGLTGKETAEIYGQETAIIHIAVHIRHAIKGHGCFCMVKATFVWGEKWANISLDTPPIALFDILRQIFPAFR